MSTLVTDLDTLQALVGKLPAPRDLKVIDHLDEHALRWLAASPLLFATLGDGSGITVTAGGGEAGFLHAGDPRFLQLPAAVLDDPQLAREGQGEIRTRPVYCLTNSVLVGPIDSI